MSTMGNRQTTTSVASQVRSKIIGGGDRLWRADDFAGLSQMAVMAELSRLARDGQVHRVAKGVYYRPGRWAMGETRPKSAAVVASAVRTPIHPAGLTAANALGLTTQNTALPEMAVSTAKTPTVLRSRAYVRTGRSSARGGLTTMEVAVLEVLRDRASTSDLTPDETIGRLIDVLNDNTTFARLAQAAVFEPPRVRAMLGALGQLAGASRRELERLRLTLNPFTRYDFGVLSALPTARSWQAKGTH